MYAQNAGSSSARSRRLRGLLAAWLLCCLTTVLQADVVHKWVDEKGRVHFGDRPPKHLKTEVLILNVVTPGRAAPATVTEPEEPANAAEWNRRDNTAGREKEKHPAASFRHRGQADDARRAAQEAARQERLRELTGTYGTRPPATREPVDSRF